MSEIIKSIGAQAEDANPFASKPVLLGGVLMRIHLGFIAIWMLLGGVIPVVRVLVIQLLSPVSMLMTYLNPRVAEMYFGPYGSAFYTAIASETMLMGFVQAVLWTSGVVQFYWYRPWGFIEHFERRGKFRMFSLTGLLFLLVTGALFTIMGFVFLYWFGFRPYPGPQGQIQLFQLGLWSVVAISNPLLIVMSAAIFLSAIAYLAKRIFDAV